VLTQFTQSAALKAKNHEQRANTKFRSRPGALFSSGLCDIGAGNKKQTYVVRITDAVAAQSIVNIPPGTRIRLPKASFVDSYGNSSNKDISCNTYIVKTDGIETTSASSTTDTTTTSTGWFIYPSENGIKHKNGVVVHRPMLLVHTKNGH
jgi:hypothetical protein